MVFNLKLETQTVSDQIRLIVRFETSVSEAALIQALRGMKSRNVKLTRVLTETVELGDLDVEHAVAEAISEVLAEKDEPRTAIVRVDPKINEVKSGVLVQTAYVRPAAQEEPKQIDPAKVGAQTIPVSRLKYRKAFNGKEWRNAIDIEASMQALGVTLENVCNPAFRHKRGSDMDVLRNAITHSQKWREELARLDAAMPSSSKSIAPDGKAYVNGEIVKVVESDIVEEGLLFDRVYRYYTTAKSTIPSRKIAVERSLKRLGKTKEQIMGGAWARKSPEGRLLRAIEASNRN